MNLPDDLAGVERDLTARSRPEPSPNLRPRVLAAVAHELARSSTNTNTNPSRRIRPRQLIISSCTAAALALTITIWQSISPPRLPAPPKVGEISTPLHSFDDRLTTCRGDLLLKPLRRRAVLVAMDDHLPARPRERFDNRSSYPYTAARHQRHASAKIIRLVHWLTAPRIERQRTATGLALQIDPERDCGCQGQDAQGSLPHSSLLSRALPQTGHAAGWSRRTSS